MNTAVAKTNSQQDTQREPQYQRHYMPNVDVLEDKDSVKIEVDIPGVDRNQVDLSVENGTLTIKAAPSYQHPEGFRAMFQEWIPGSFERAFQLSESVDTDKIDAVVKNGVLTINIPKREEVKTRKIEIK